MLSHRTFVQLMGLLLYLLAPQARAESLEWHFPLDPGHVASIEILGADGVLITRLLTADGSQQRQFGWRPDIDEAEGQVAGSLPELWLSPGTYTIRERSPNALRSRSFESVASGARLVQVSLLPGATGVLAWHWSSEGGHDGLGWAPAFPGDVTFLGVGPGTWRATQIGGLPSSTEDIREDRTQVAIQARRPAPAPQTDRSHQGLVRWGLVPVTLLFAGVAAWCLRRAWRTDGLGLAAAVSAVCAAASILPVLLKPASSILNQEITHTDPVDSVAQVASLSDSLLRLSDITYHFNFPQGASWIVTGPSWLAYIVPALLAHAVGPLVAHNLGIGLAQALLGIGAWGLARTLGVSPRAALLATVGAIFTPAIMAELSLLSLDRSAFALVPFFFLALHKAAEEEGQTWPLLAGTALAALFYGQIHYGLFTAAACPLLVLPRLIGPAPHRRLLRMVTVGVVALILLAPGLYVLQTGTEATPYQSESPSLRESARDLLHPIDFSKTGDYIAQWDPRRGARNPPMDTPEDRLLAAMARSLDTGNFLRPRELLPGRAAWWFWLAAAVALSTRRRAALVAALDVAILMVFALGPFLRIQDQFYPIPLPFYLDFLLIPGFEQLKQVQRFEILAGAIAAVPLAMGLHGAFERLAFLKRSRSWRFPYLAEAAIIPLLMVFLVVLRKGTFAWVWPLHLYDANGVFRPPILVIPPTVTLQPMPQPPALHDLRPGGALVLPLQTPTTARQSVACLQAGLYLVNESPFGASKDSNNTFWFERSPLLNRILWVSGSDRPQTFLSLADPEADMRDLAAEGLRYVVLFRDLLPGPELALPTETFLDKLMPRIQDDGTVAVWELAP